MKYLILIFLIVGFFYIKPTTLNDIKVLKPSTVSVEVRGHLKNPGLFTIASYSNFETLKEHLDLYEDSDYEHLKLNKVLKDQDIIVIKKEEDVKKISINSGSLEELCTLKGIGEKTALRIIEFRQTQTFSSLEDIKQVKGIGDSIFQNIKDSIIL